MVFVQICVGSSCHLKGSQQIVAMMQQKIADGGLGEEIILSGGFCAGKCNRVGVTVTVDDDVYAGVTPETFYSFWEERIRPRLDAKEEN